MHRNSHTPRIYAPIVAFRAFLYVPIFTYFRIVPQFSIHGIGHIYVRVSERRLANKVQNNLYASLMLQVRLLA